MKQQALRFITVLLSLSCYLSLGGQTSDWYLQVGSGYMIVEQLNQLGFEKSSPSFTGFAEAGKLHQPVSVGVQSTFRQEYGFYRYAIKQQIRSVYVKYSFNKGYNQDWRPIDRLTTSRLRVTLANTVSRIPMIWL
ncbi:MAG: hypothetical protein OEM26_03640 [Saprospiraceae bacterium]|nr:hypothetical protein [Saprospiraceae bacterium]